MTSNFLQMGKAGATGGAAAAAASMTPRPGAGALLTATAGMGFAISARSKSQSFKHNFRPFLSALGLRLSFGTVSGKEPTIGDSLNKDGSLQSRGARMSQTVLKLDPSQVTPDGESWACVEVQTEQGIITAKSRVEVIHTNAPNDFTPTRAREPIALIVWRKRNPVRVEPIRQWCMTYLRIQESATFYRHVFL